MDIDEKQLKDEQELAKVLAGINTDTPDKSAEPKKADTAMDNPAEAALKAAEEAADKAAAKNPVPPQNINKVENLDTVLQSAVKDLRPLMDKLDIPADEKFDTYLLLIRSTDDVTLIPPAYQTARQITDEGKRATALLNIIKEINYFNNKKLTIDRETSHKTPT